MRVLLDTHALAWALTAPERLTAVVRDVLLDGSTTVCVSAVSPWEIATKHRVGKWADAPVLLAALDAALRGARFQGLPITLAHAERAGSMPGEHRDPFDRMLAAQSEMEAAALVSADPAFRSLGLTPLWTEALP